MGGEDLALAAGGGRAMREQGKYIYTTGSIRSFGLWETSRFTLSSIWTLCSFIIFLRFLTLT